MCNSAWYVYIVCCSDGSLYTGIAKDVEKRVFRHNSGTGAKYTRSRRPVELVHVESAGDHSAALRREQEIKSLSADAKRWLIDRAS